MAVTTALVASVIAANLMGPVDANAFLSAGAGGNARISADAVQSTLLAEIEGSIGSAVKRGRMARLEAALSSMYASLPKNEFGKLGHTTVRYALHRLFVQQHGWYVKGLDPAGDVWNNTSPAGILKDKVSSEVVNLMEARLDGHGFGLHDTAVLAATLEHLVHDEALERLNKAYEMKNFEKNVHLDNVQTEQILDSYMKLYILPEELALIASDEDMMNAYPGWRETQDFVHDVKRELMRTEHGNKPSFPLMQTVVEEVGERFGRFQDAECRQMKDQLVALNDHGIGRVQIADFYRPALDDNSFAFQESLDYLRELGALDETDPTSPSVIVPNYVNAPSNCIASSSFYSVCCLDECEQLMGHLESSIKAPEAPVQTILDLVSNLPSSTVEAPRALQTSLVEKLHEVAEPHAGYVQLHGRMFGQWMHHAFPRECPFPHVAGTTAPRTPDEWMDTTGAESFATLDEMRKFVEQEAKSPSEIHGEDLKHWAPHEELLVPRAQKRTSSSPVWSFIRTVMFFAAIAAFGIHAFTSTSKATSTLSASFDGKAGKLV
jgi:hypothetical protein